MVVSSFEVGGRQIGVPLPEYEPAISWVGTRQVGIETLDSTLEVGS